MVFLPRKAVTLLQLRISVCVCVCVLKLCMHDFGLMFDSRYLSQRLLSISWLSLLLVMGRSDHFNSVWSFMVGQFCWSLMYMTLAADVAEREFVKGLSNPGKESRWLGRSFSDLRSILTPGRIFRSTVKCLLSHLSQSDYFDGNPLPEDIGRSYRPFEARCQAPCGRSLFERKRKQRHFR